MQGGCVATVMICTRHLSDRVMRCYYTDSLACLDYCVRIQRLAFVMQGGCVETVMICTRHLSDQLMQYDPTDLDVVLGEGVKRLNVDMLKISPTSDGVGSMEWQFECMHTPALDKAEQGENILF